MRKSTLLLSGLMATTCLMAAGTPKKVKDFSDMNFFKNKGVTIINSMDVDGLSVVSTMVETPKGPQKINVFVTKDRKNVIVGAGYNDKTGEPLMVPIHMEQYKSQAAMTIGTGKKDIYVFTDPECPYCQKMEKDVLENISTKDYTVHVFLFPLSFHQHAEAMSLYILSQQDNVGKIKALRDISNGSQDFLNASFTEAQRATLKETLEKQKSVAKDLAVTGTPSVFNSVGVPVNWTTLISGDEKK